MRRPISVAAPGATPGANPAAGSGLDVRWAITDKGRAALAVEPGAVRRPGRCAWCGNPILPDQASSALGVGGAELHDEPCAADYDAAAGGADASDRAEPE